MSCDRVLFVLGLAWLASVPALGAHIEITPASMKEHRLHIECRCEATTIKEGDQPTRPTGMFHVVVKFDAEKGPKIRDIRETSFQVPEKLFVPLRADRDPDTKQILGVQFDVHRDLLSKTTLRLTAGAVGSFRGTNYHVRISDFLDATSDVPNGNRLRANGDAIDLERIHAFYVTSSDELFLRPRLPSLLAVNKEDLPEERYEKLYLSAAGGEIPVAHADGPFLLIGGLIPSGHPSGYDYRVLDAAFDGRTINCRLQFI